MSLSGRKRLAVYTVFYEEGRGTGETPGKHRQASAGHPEYSDQIRVTGTEETTNRKAATTPGRRAGALRNRWIPLMIDCSCPSELFLQ